MHVWTVWLLVCFFWGGCLSAFCTCNTHRLHHDQDWPERADSHSPAVVLLRLIVVHRNSFLKNSPGSGVAVGFHELLRWHRWRQLGNVPIAITRTLKGTPAPPYLHQLIFPEIQFYGFDPAGQAAVDARAGQTHKYPQFVGSPLWIYRRECVCRKIVAHNLGQSFSVRLHHNHFNNTKLCLNKAERSLEISAMQ